MRAVGLITEYNPFHNGHLHHLRESLRVSGCEVAVAVMSGHFLQRGEPALVDKWVRAEMALRAGVDVVLELPFPFACNSAQHFALGAVRTLEALSGVTDLCFGSECGDLETLRCCADLLLEREDEIRERTSALLRTGVNYPAARAEVFAELTGEGADTLSTPNNILGIEYLKALRVAGSTIIPHAIPRIGAGYHQTEAVGTIASATGIRRMLAAGDEIEPFIPESVRPPLQGALESGRHLHPDALHRLLVARILRGHESLAGLYQVEPGIAARLYLSASESVSWDFLAERAKARHLTRTRVQRILCYILNESSAAEMDEFLAAGPLYLRLLAASERGRAFLAATRKKRTLPVLANMSRGGAALKKCYGGNPEALRIAERMLEADLQASRNYTVLMKAWEGNRNRDYFEEVRG